MGLSITVGLLAEWIARTDRSEEEEAANFQVGLAPLNQALVSNGLLAHIEPKRLKIRGDRSMESGFPYSFIHYLRRANVYLRLGRESHFQPIQGQDPTQDPIFQDDVPFDSHLNGHSDCDGVYVPQWFEEVIVDQSVEGEMIGSSQGLMEELSQLAPLLGIQLRADNNIDTDEVNQINRLSKGQDDPLWIEKIVWFRLYESARLSIANHALIVFL